MKLAGTTKDVAKAVRRILSQTLQLAIPPDRLNPNTTIIEYHV